MPANESPSGMVLEIKDLLVALGVKFEGDVGTDDVLEATRDFLDATHRKTGDKEGEKMTQEAMAQAGLRARTVSPYLRKVNPYKLVVGQQHRRYGRPDRQTVIVQAQADFNVGGTERRLTDRHGAVQSALIDASLPGLTEDEYALIPD